MPQEYCEIIFRGVIEDHWMRWFEDMRITPLEDGTTRLEGTVVDDAAFNGLVSKVKDIGLSIILVRRSRISTEAE